MQQLKELISFSGITLRGSTGVQRPLPVPREGPVAPPISFVMWTQVCVSPGSVLVLFVMILG